MKTASFYCKKVTKKKEAKIERDLHVMCWASSLIFFPPSIALHSDYLEAGFTAQKVDVASPVYVMLIVFVGGRSYEDSAAALVLELHNVSDACLFCRLAVIKNTL